VSPGVVFCTSVTLAYNVYHNRYRTRCDDGGPRVPLHVMVLASRRSFGYPQSTSRPPSLIILVVAGVSVYVGLLALIQRPLLVEIWQLIRLKRSQVTTESEA
jgi:hypothetical protein